MNPTATLHPQTNTAIVAALLAAAGDDVQVAVNAGERFISVRVITDDGVMFRSVVSHSNCMGAVFSLNSADRHVTGEFFIDSMAPLDACVYDVDFDEDDMIALDYTKPRPFNSDTLLFLHA